MGVLKDSTHVLAFQLDLNKGRQVDVAVTSITKQIMTEGQIGAAFRCNCLKMNRRCSRKKKKSRKDQKEGCERPSQSGFVLNSDGICKLLTLDDFKSLEK